MECKRRMPPFTHEEVEFLKESVFRRKEVIESRVNTNDAIAKKTVAWTEITEEFNAIPAFSKRTEKHLKKCWDNIKTQQKRGILAEKRARMKTGGGAEEKTLPDEPHFGNNEDVEAFAMEFAAPDSDAVALANVEGNSSKSYVLQGGLLHEVTEEEICVGAEDMIPSDDFEVLEVDMPSSSRKSPKTQQSRRNVRGKPFDEHSLRCKRVKLQIEKDLQISKLLLREAELKVTEAELRVEGQKIINKTLQLQYEKAVTDKENTNN